MCNKLLLVVTLAFLLSHTVISLPTIIETTTNTFETLNEDSEQNIKTTEKSVLGDKQTEIIKRIIAEHQDLSSEYTTVTKREPQQQEIDKIPFEQLKVKCQQLARLFGINNISSLITTSRPQNHKYPDFHSRPVYYPTRATFRPIKYPQTPKPNGFYVTTQSLISTTTKKPQIAVNDQGTTPIKYIRLEPVILQKTILGDGRVVYLWHKSLPTAVEYPNGYSPNQQGEKQNGFNANNNNYYPNNLGYSPQYGYYYGTNQYPYRNNYQSSAQIQAINGNIQTTTESTTTTTTEQSKSYGYGFGNFLPFYNYRHESSPSSTTEPSTTTTTTTSTTTKPPTQTTSEASEILYAQQLKFVVPVPVNDDEGTIPVRDPWSFNPYVYYPKPLQPNSINVKVPYNPMFHVIKAVKVPTLEDKKIGNGI